MGRKSTKRHSAKKTTIHVSLEPQFAARLCAFAGYHRRPVSDVLAEGAKIVMRGFSARQDLQIAAGLPDQPATEAA
jgi:hypothetical protein